MRTLKALVVLVILGLGGLLGYAYFGDMEPPRREVDQPVPLGPATPAAPAGGVDGG